MHKGKTFEKRRKRKKKNDDPLLGRGFSQEIERPEVQDKLPGFKSSSEDFRAVWLVIACTMAVGAGLMSGGIILIIHGKHNNVTDFLVLGSCGVVTGLCFSVVAVVRMCKSIRQTPSKSAELQHGGALPARRNSASRAARIKMLNEQKFGSRRNTKKNKQGIDGDQQKLLIESNKNKSPARAPIQANQNKSTVRAPIQDNQNKSTVRAPIQANQNKSTGRSVHFTDVYNDNFQNDGVVLTKCSHNRNVCVPRVEVSTTVTAKPSTTRANQSLDTLYISNSDTARKHKKFTTTTNSTKTVEMRDDKNSKTASASERPPDLEATRHKSELKIVLSTNTGLNGEQGIVAIKQNTEPAAVHTVACPNKRTNDLETALVQPSSKNLIRTVVDITPYRTVVDITPYNPGQALTTIDMLPIRQEDSTKTLVKLSPHVRHNDTKVDMLSSHLRHTDAMIDMLPYHRRHTDSTIDIMPSHLGQTVTSSADVFTPTRVISPLEHSDVKYFSDSGKSSVTSSSISQSFNEGDTKETNIFSKYFPQIWDQSTHSLNSPGNTNWNTSLGFSRTDSFPYDLPEQTIKKQVWSKRGRGITVSRQKLRNHGIYVMDDQIEVLESE